MKLYSDGQLLTTTLTACYRGKALELSDIIIDTGSSHTVFSPEALETIGVTYENGDPVYEAYGLGGTVPFYTKVLEYMMLDTFQVNEIEVDIGVLPKNHKGLLGLDILQRHGFVLDLDKLVLYRSDISKD